MVEEGVDDVVTDRGKWRESEWRCVCGRCTVRRKGKRKEGCVGRDLREEVITTGEKIRIKKFIRAAVSIR